MKTLDDMIANKKRCIEFFESKKKIIDDNGGDTEHEQKIIENAKEELRTLQTFRQVCNIVAGTTRNKSTATEAFKFGLICDLVEGIE